MAGWAIALGALLGVLLGSWDGPAALIGAFVGGVAWVIMRNTARTEARAALQPLREELEETLRLIRREAETRESLGNVVTAPTPVREREREPEPEPVAPMSVPILWSESREPAAPPEDEFEYLEAAPRAPSAVDLAVARARAWLLGGNTIVRVGLLVLFVGLSFLARYAAAAGLFPVELRLALVAAVGIALLVVGFRTRLARPAFGLALQGGGVAVLYLTLFAAAKLLGLIPALVAFGFMVAVCALGCALALLQRSQALAVTAFAGGFAVPLLLSSGGGPITALFAYYTLLNLAILAIAWRASWRLLNLLGFAATFTVASLWWWQSYGVANYWPAQIFLVVNVLVYLGIVLLQGRESEDGTARTLDAALLFGPALVGFGLQVRLLRDDPFGSAFAALGFGAVYLGIAALVLRRRPHKLKLMSEALLAIGIGFVTLAIPLALGARWTSAAWALEGAGAVWLGLRQGRWLPRAFGLALQLTAAVLLFTAPAAPGFMSVPLANAQFLGAVLVAGALGFSAWLLRTPVHSSSSAIGRSWEAIEGRLATPLFLLGFLIWWAGWANEAIAWDAGKPRFAQPLPDLLTVFAFVASARGAQYLAKRTGWTAARHPSRFTIFVLGWATAQVFITAVFDSSRGGYGVVGTLIWFASAALHLHMLRENDRVAPLPYPRLQPFVHAAGIWVALGAALTLYVALINRALVTGDWGVAGFVALIALALIALVRWSGGRRGDGWPLDLYRSAYLEIAATPVALVLAPAAALLAIFAEGNVAPLPFVPILNAVDLAVLLAIGALLLWRVMITRAGDRSGIARWVTGRRGLVIVGGLAFIEASMAWVRLASHLFGLDWSDALFSDFGVQAGLAILWTLLALAAMVFAHRHRERGLWLAGAALLGATVLKLLLVDLNAAAGAARIVAFIGVGLLMLLVGYLAPLPPRDGREEARL